MRARREQGEEEENEASSLFAVDMLNIFFLLVWEIGDEAHVSMQNICE